MDWGLLSDCASDGLGHVVDVAAALLRVANATPAETSADHRDAALEAERDLLRARVCALLPLPPAEYLTEVALGELAAALTATRLRPGFAALTAAHAIDAWCGHRFIDYFRGDRPPLAPGDPVPVVGFPAPTLAGDDGKRLLRAIGRPTSRPHALTPEDDRSRRLRLAPPEVARFRVRLRWAEPHLTPIDASWRFAAAVTNHDLVAEFDCHRYQHGEARVFYPVAPRDPDDQRARIHRALAAARASRATALVVPELTTTKAIVDELAGSGALADLPLCALGSYHEPGPGPGHNRCRVFARGVEIARHDKFSDYEDPLGHREHLVADPAAAGLDVLLAAGAAVIVLICKDALDQRVAGLVAGLAPTLVLIPAMSTKTRPFETLAERLADDPQAFCLVASASGEHAAIFGRPGSTPATPPVVKRNASDQRVFVFTVDGAEVEVPTLV
jgi:predicted amidohydrolase